MKYNKGNWKAIGTNIEVWAFHKKVAWFTQFMPIGQMTERIEEAKANAKLIAAAPELLEVLQDCLFELKIADQENPNKGFKRSIKKAKEAIKKAES
jgi:hypothetical protein